MNDTKEKHATHTPGPWSLSCIDGVKDSLMVGGGDDGSDIVADIRTYENYILDVRADHQSFECNTHAHKRLSAKIARLERKEKESWANARLIAAAPELLEQCKLFEKCLTHLINSGHSGADLERDNLREVLAKVDGGEG